MSVFFDCRFIRPASPDGISRFSQQLFTALSELLPLTAIISDLDQLELLPSNTRYLMANDPANPIGELMLPKLLNKHGAEVVFSPMQTTGSFGRKYRLILTQHDLIYYRHRKPPAFLKPYVRLAWRLFHLSFAPARLILNRADVVATISQTTTDLMIRHRLTKRPIAILPNAASWEIGPARDQPENRQLIYIGSFMPYKNVELLIKAMAELPRFSLLLLSSITDPRRAELSKLIDPKGGRVEFLSGVSEQRYRQLAQESFAMVTASKDEGFGIPLVEAHSQGLPVVCSDIPIFREVAGKAGLFFSPESVSELVAQLSALESPAKWAQLSRLGQKRAENFSWNKSARVLKELIDSLRG